MNSQIIFDWAQGVWARYTLEEAEELSRITNDEDTLNLIKKISEQAKPLATKTLPVRSFELSKNKDSTNILIVGITKEDSDIASEKINNNIILYYTFPLNFKESLDKLHKTIQAELEGFQSYPNTPFFPYLSLIAEELKHALSVTDKEYWDDIIRATYTEEETFPTKSGKTITILPYTFIKELTLDRRKQAIEMLYSYLSNKVQFSDDEDLTDLFKLTHKTLESLGGYPNLTPHQKLMLKRIVNALWDHDTELAFSLLVRFKKFVKNAEKYLKKKLEESGNYTYIYSEKHVKERNKKKANRLKKLSKSLKKLRSQVSKDLSSEDPAILLPATAVALIDETYERVGNIESAGELKHYGVTTWLKKHVTFRNNKAKIKYVGKAGVKQEKQVKNPKLVKILKKLSNDKKPSDKLLSLDDISLTDKRVNKYLSPFKITAKDIRGFHANREMIKHLKKSSIPKTEKERKAKFKEALESTAKIVGHTTGALKNQYLIPKLEQNYISNGKISSIASYSPLIKIAMFDFLPDQKTPPKGYQIMEEESYKNIPSIELTDSEYSAIMELAYKYNIDPDELMIRSSEKKYLYLQPIVQTKHGKKPIPVINLINKSPESLWQLQERIKEKLNKKQSYKYDLIPQKASEPMIQLSSGDYLNLEHLFKQQFNKDLPAYIKSTEEDVVLVPLRIGNTRLSRFLAKMIKKNINSDSESDKYLLNYVLHKIETATTATDWSLVISSEPQDIKHMSTNKGWTSCIEQGKCNFKHLDNAVSTFDMVAYAISQDSPNWLARVWLRFDGKGKWWPEANVYSTGKLDSQDFLDAVNKYLKEKSILGTQGEYHPEATGYSDFIHGHPGEEEEIPKTSFEKSYLIHFPINQNYFPSYLVKTLFTHPSHSYAFIKSNPEMIEYLKDHNFIVSSQEFELKVPYKKLTLILGVDTFWHAIDKYDPNATNEQIHEYSKIIAGISYDTSKLFNFLERFVKSTLMQEIRELDPTAKLKSIVPKLKRDSCYVEITIYCLEPINIAQNNLLDDKYLILDSDY